MEAGFQILGDFKAWSIWVHKFRQESSHGFRDLHPLFRPHAARFSPEIAEWSSFGTRQRYGK
jgi:hypothetical protein